MLDAPPAAAPGLYFLIWSIGFSLLALPALWRLFRRAGLNPWPALTIFLPLVGFPVALTLLGFPAWPNRPLKIKKNRK